MFSNVAQISKTLFNNLLFRQVELARFVFGNFLQKKTKQRFEVLKLSCQALLCGRAQIFGQSERPVLGSHALTSFFRTPRSLDHALRASIRSSESSTYAMAKPPNTAYDKTNARRMASH